MGDDKGVGATLAAFSLWAGVYFSMFLALFLASSGLIGHNGDVGWVWCFTGLFGVACIGGEMLTRRGGVEAGEAAVGAIAILCLCSLFTGGAWVATAFKPVQALRIFVIAGGIACFVMPLLAFSVIKGADKLEKRKRWRRWDAQARLIEQRNGRKSRNRY